MNIPITQFLPIRRGGIINPFKVGQEALQRGIDFVFAGDGRRPPALVRKFLHDHVNSIITGIKIFREPINRVIDKVVNIISLGYWQDIKDKLHYDNLFHLWMEVDLNDGTSWSMEKNEVVQVKHVKNKQGGIHIPVNKQITINKFFESGKMVLGNRFWTYRAKDNNCQVWVASMLIGSGFLTDQAKNFIIQDTETLISELPTFTERVINGTTDIAARFDILRHGSKLKRHKKQRK
jgi:hypothetical protein